MGTLGTDFHALRQLVTETVRLRSRASTDAYNEVTWSAWSSEFPAYWQQAQEAVRNERGEETVAASVLYVLPSADTALPAVTSEWEIELPDATVAKTLIGVNLWRDEHGVVQCIEAMVGAQRR